MQTQRSPQIAVECPQQREAKTQRKHVGQKDRHTVAQCEGDCADRNCPLQPEVVTDEAIDYAAKEQLLLEWGDDPDGGEHRDRSDGADTPCNRVGR